MKILLVAINAKYIHSNPAVYSLYAYAEKWKEHLEIAQYNINQQTSDILADIYRRRPDMVALSCYIWNMTIVRQLLVDINQVLPKTDIWLGGPEVSFDAPSLMEEYPMLTGVMTGEGESSFEEIVKCYVNMHRGVINIACDKDDNAACDIDDDAACDSDDDAVGDSDDCAACDSDADVLCDKVLKSRDFIINLSAIPGLWLNMKTCRNNSCERDNIITRGDRKEKSQDDIASNGDKANSIQDDIIYTGDRELTNLDDIPFIYNDEVWEEFNNRIIYYESSRGCPFRCSYCLSAIDKSVRLRSLNLVFPELQFFLDRKVPQVKFIDRTFNCNREHALAIWRYILEHDNGVTNFHFEVAADLLTDEEIDLIKQMRPGLIQLEIGVQSTNLKTIKEINRSMNLDRLARNVARIHSFGNTHQHLDLIVGLPYEDKASFIKSFNDVYTMEPDQLQLGFLKVLKGSVMEGRRDEYDLKYHSTPQYEVFSTRWISYREVLELKKIEEMVELLYNSSQFATALRVLLPKFQSPYDFFEKIAEFYDEKGYFIQTPARSYRYNVVYEFGKAYVDEELLAQALTFDLYLRENCKSRVDFAKDLTAYKSRIRDLSGEKEGRRQAHIDVYDYILWDETAVESMQGCIAEEYRLAGGPLSQDIKEIQSNGAILKKKIGTKLDQPAYVRFDYTSRNPLSGDAKIAIL